MRQDQPNLPIARSKLLHPVVLIILAIWGGLMFQLAHSGALDPKGSEPPLGIAIATVVPPTLFMLAYWQSQLVRTWVEGLDLGLVVALQSWRVVGAAFVFTWGFGMLPAAFAIPAGYGDIFVGLAAPFVAFAIWQRRPGWKASGYALIIAGFLDFMGAFIMGVALRENGPFWEPGAVHTGPMAEFPLTVIPSFFVPAFMILHIIAFIKLRKTL